MNVRPTMAGRGDAPISDSGRRRRHRRPGGRYDVGGRSGELQRRRGTFPMLAITLGTSSDLFRNFFDNRAS